MIEAVYLGGVMGALIVLARRYDEVMGAARRSGCSPVLADIVMACCIAAWPLSVLIGLWSRIHARRG